MLKRVLSNPALPVILLAALLVAAFALSRGEKKPDPDAARPEETIAVGEPAPPANAPTPEGYEEAVAAALAAFFTERETWPKGLNDERGAMELLAVRAAKNRLADVIVPSNRRDDHLSLVLALAQIEQGIADKDTELWKKGEKWIEEYLRERS